MNKYVIGVDIGATKSHLALFNTAGGLVDFRHWGPLNHEVLPGSFAQFEDELGQFVAQTLSSNNIEIGQIEYAVFGVAGVDTRRQHRIISDIIEKLGFRQFKLCNDAFLGIPAGSPSGYGICAINGTGCTLAGINKGGKTLQIGGVGMISSDMGGGGYLGELALSAIYTELFRKGEPTCMTPVLFEKLGISNKYDYIEVLSEKIADGSLNVGLCGRMVFEAVCKNDDVASRILCDVAESYAGGITCMIEELQFPHEGNLYIVLAGSIFVKGEHPLMLDTLKERVCTDNPGHRIQFTLLDTPPVAGAVLWALNNIDSENDYYDAVCTELRNRQ